jgi:L-iditol 2-dehydrogenase
VIRAQRLAAIERGQTLLILGSGMSGLLHVKLGKLKGCQVFSTDISPKRLEMARRLGADHTADAACDIHDQILHAYCKKADAVIVTTSALPALAQAWEAVDMGGVVVLFAVPAPGKAVVVPVNDFWRKEIRIITSYYCGPPDIEEALALIKHGDIVVDDLISHRLPLKDTAKGFRMLMDGADALKIIIKPHEL